MFVVATSVLEFAQTLGSVFYFVVMPMLLLVALGYGLSRGFNLDMKTLVRLNFYVFVPGMVYHALVSSQVTAGDVGLMVGFHVVMIFLLIGVTYTTALIRRVPGDRRNAMLMSVIFYNSGNYGFPLQKLAFDRVGTGGQAEALQIFAILVQNFSGFTLGVLLAATGGGGGRIKSNLLHLFRFPPLYGLVAAGTTILLREQILTAEQATDAAYALTPVWKALGYVRGGFVPVALITLGAQLAQVAEHHEGHYPVKTSVFLRLIGAPIIALGLLAAVSLFFPGLMSPFVAQVLFVSTAVPTAINAMLMCLEFGNHPSYLARVVFWSTLLSPVTVTFVIYFAQSGLIPFMRIAA